MRKIVKIILTILILTLMVSGFVSAQPERITREGMAAAELLKLAHSSLQYYDTCKLKGSMNIKTNVRLPAGEEESVIIGIEKEELLQLSKEQLEAVGMYARYDDDVEIDGKEYYVVKVDLKTETFEKVYGSIIDETFKYIFGSNMLEQMKTEQGVLKGVDEENFEIIVKSAINELLQNAEVEMMQEYYISKESKTCSTLKLKQIIYMDLMDVETKIEMDGEFQYSY